jgi:hypothetical protein
MKSNALSLLLVIISVQILYLSPELNTSFRTMVVIHPKFRKIKYFRITTH